MQSARNWPVVNPSAQNALGHHTSYILVPAPTRCRTSRGLSVRQRAFINNHFWATQYHAAELAARRRIPTRATAAMACRVDRGR